MYNKNEFILYFIFCPNKMVTAPLSRLSSYLLGSWWHKRPQRQEVEEGRGWTFLNIQATHPRHPFPPNLSNTNKLIENFFLPQLKPTESELHNKCVSLLSFVSICFYPEALPTHVLILSLSVRNLNVAGHPSSVHQLRLWDGPPIRQWYTRSPQEVTPVIAISNDYSIWGVIPDIPGQTL